MSRGTRYTKAQLQQLGFHKIAEGEWGGNDIPAGNTQPPAPIAQHDECGSTMAKDADQGEGKGRIRFRVVVHSYRTNLIDASNASIKQIEDCLTPAQGRKTYGLGIVPDDSPEYCDQPLFLQTKVKKGHERTIIEVLKYTI